MLCKVKGGVRYQPKIQKAKFKIKNNVCPDNFRKAFNHYKYSLDIVLGYQHFFYFYAKKQDK